MSIIERYGRAPEEIVRDAYPTRLDALRRKELEKLLDYNDIAYTPSDRKDVLVEIARAHEPAGGWKIPPDGYKPRADRPAAGETAPSDDPDVRPLHKMKPPELKKVCRQRGVPTEKHDTKADLLARLEAASRGGALG